MSMLRRILFALTMLATVWAASGFLAQARAEMHPIQALGATIALPEGWSRDDAVLGGNAPAELTPDYHGVFYANRDEGRYLVSLVVIAATGTDMLSSDNLDGADPMDLRLLRESLRDEMDAENITTFRTSQTMALCFHSKDMDNQRAYGAYVRYRGIDVFLMESASTGRQLLSRDYETFRGIVASLVFEEARAPRSAGESFLGLETVRAWMEALESDLYAYDVSDIAVEYAASASLASGTNAAHYLLRYGGYDASVLLECGPGGLIRDINFYFPCGLVYQDEDDPRMYEDLQIVLCASDRFLRDVNEDQVLEIMVDLYGNILNAVDSAPPREWIWRYGIGFYGTYLPDAQSVLVILRVGEPEAV